MRAELLQRQGNYAAAVRDYSHVLLKSNIDTPSNGARVSGRVFAGGWAFSKGPAIVGVPIYIDNAPFAEATMGIERPDVARAFPEASNALVSGWQAIVETSGIAAGEHVLSVHAKLLDGSLLEVGSIKIVVFK